MFPQFFTLCAILLLTACTAVPDSPVASEDSINANAWAKQPLQQQPSPPSDQAATAVWQHYPLPGKQATVFSYARLDGRDTMTAQAQASASMLRQSVHVPPADLGQVRFSWKVSELLAQADMALRDADDSPVRVVLAFEGDRSQFSAKNAMLSELSQALTGEPLPYATLMYVWCNTREPGTVIVNPRTDRIRKLVVASGSSQLDIWQDYERDIRADYEKVFGEPPGALVAVGIMTDADNTRSTAQAWYGPIRLVSEGR